jgi:hypothetical protein
MIVITDVQRSFQPRSYRSLENINIAIRMRFRAVRFHSFLRVASRRHYVPVVMRYVPDGRCLCASGCLFLKVKRIFEAGDISCKNSSEMPGMANVTNCDGVNDRTNSLRKP